MVRSGKLGWIELVVLIVLVGVLAAMLAPALLRGREQSRTAQCEANLTQLGVALHAYRDAYHVPPAAFQPDREAQVSLKPGRPGHKETATVTHLNWAAMLLPYLEDGEAAEAFDPGRAIWDEANAEGRSRELPVMKCPSDEYNSPENAYVLETEAGQTSVFARGNYAINGGSSAIYTWPGNTSAPVASGIVKRQVGPAMRWLGSGVAGFNAACAPHEFPCGFSNIVAVDEIRAGIRPYDCRGVWALGLIGASVTYAHGLYGDAQGPNATWWRSDDTSGCPQLHEELGRERIAQEGMTCLCDAYTPIQATSRSQHPGGVNVLMLDGAIRFVSDDVDPDVWHVIHSRDTRIDIDPADLASSSDGAAVYTTTDVSAPTAESLGVLPKDAPEPSGKHLTNSVGMQFVEIPRGRFVMGLPDEGASAVEEVPAHVVDITRAYWLGVHEVTQEQYEKVSGSNPSYLHKGGWGGWRLKTDDTTRFPVESVSWNDAVDFCLKLSDREEERQAGLYYRLPTEAEWEYACRGGLSAPYHYRRDRAPDDDSGENGGGSEGHPRTDPLPIVAVGSYRPNRFGLYDMRGNVWEWCSDRYSRDYYATSPGENPQGSAAGVLRVFRGADWVFCGNPCMINMHTAQPTVSNRYVGLRVVCIETKDKSRSEASSAREEGATP